MHQCFLKRGIAGTLGVLSASVLVAGSVPGLFAAEGIVSRPGPATREDVLESLLEVGPFHIRPHVLGALTYDDNIRISSTDAQSDLILSLSPGVGIGLGNYRGSSGTFVSFDYTPTVLVYFDHDENSTVDHTVSLNSQYQWTRLTLGLAQDVQLSSGGLVEAGDRVDRSIYVTTLTAHYQMSLRTSFEVNFRQTISVYDGLAVEGYNEWVNQDWVNYAYSERTTFGVGVTVGVRDVRGSLNETFEQVLARVGYSLTEKIDLSASAGGEFRQYQGGGSDDPSFVFSLGGAYRPRDGTEIGVDAYRQDRSSVVSLSENYLATGVRASVRQAFYEHFAASVSVGYQHSSYRSTVTLASTGRADDYLYVGPGLDWHVSEHLDAGLFYLYRKNVSDDAGFEFSNNQVGVRASYRF